MSLPHHVAAMGAEPPASGGGDWTEIQNDTFTEASDTAIESHTPDSGPGWTVHVIAGAAANIGIDAALDGLQRQGGSGSQVGAVVYDGSVNDDQRISVTRMMRTTGNEHGLIARFTFTSASDYDGYQVTLENTAELRLYRIDGASYTEIGNWADASVNQLNTTQLICDGSTISVVHDGTERISVTDSTHSGGEIGILVANNSQGSQYFNDAVVEHRA